MDEQPRRSMVELQAVEIPESPGVYALYRGGEQMYVGKADCLHDRTWKNHSGRGTVMTSSAMRRNIAEFLRIATAADIKARRYQLTAEEVTAVRVWLDACEIAWVECATKADAKRLEDDSKAEYKPPLTKR